VGTDAFTDRLLFEYAFVTWQHFVVSLTHLGLLMRGLHTTKRGVERADVFAQISFRVATSVCPLDLQQPQSQIQDHPKLFLDYLDGRVAYAQVMTQLSEDLECLHLRLLGHHDVPVPAILRSRLPLEGGLQGSIDVSADDGSVARNP